MAASNGIRGVQHIPQRMASLRQVNLLNTRVASAEGDAAAATTAAEAATASVTELYDTSARIIGTYTVATLPAAAANVGSYARVTDLFGDKADLVLAAQSGATAYWQPIRPIYGGTIEVTGDLAIGPMTHPTAIFLTGTIGSGVTRTITLNTSEAFPGAQVELRFDGTLDGSLVVSGTGLDDPASLLVAAYGKFVCILVDDALEWRRMV